jgi:D-sedoheptulose 7-phosphate isomerase
VTDGAARNGADREGTAYITAVREALATLDTAALGRLVDRIHAARLRGGTIFVAGNGGSAATASHWVNDLSKATRGWPGARMRVVGLVDSIPWMTALANDEGYDCVFAEQLLNLGRPGDVLALISASGNSPNLVRAAETAAELGMESIALLGFDGGRLKGMVDDHLLVATEPAAYELVEDVHSVACHHCTRALLRSESALASAAAAR